jgi:catechol 2,3-dioxygenase-like lactoylglutathione lyase family enzyme
MTGAHLRTDHGAHLHHVHLFTVDLDATVRWWTETLGAEVAYDGTMGGARNVFLRLGEGRLHLYDQRPRGHDRNAVHHVGIRVKDLPALHRRLQALGVPLRSDVRAFPGWRYLMCPAPDGVLLELFEVDTDVVEPALARYFDDSSNFRGG